MMNKRCLSACLFFATTSLLAQSAAQTRPALNLPLRRVRTVPSLALYMVAYESVEKGITGTNPRLVSAMQKALNETPGAAETFAELHRRYAALTHEQRVALVGPELANATAETPLSPELIHRTFVAAMRRDAMVNEGPVTWLTDAQIAASRRRAPSARKPDSAEALDPNHEPPGIRNIKAGGAKEVEVVGLELPTQTVPKITIPPPDYYTVRFKGFFCSDEGADWGNSSEPYMIFNMVQGGKVWTTLAGPYTGTDTGDKIYRDISLLDKSTLTTPLQLQMIVMENDNWDPNKLVKAIQGGVKVYCAYESGGGDCPKGIVELLGEILDWFFGLFVNDDDQVGNVQGGTIDIKTYFKDPYHKPSYDHGFLRTSTALFDGSKTDDGKYWLFFEVRKVN